MNGLQQILLVPSVRSQHPSVFRAYHKHGIGDTEFLDMNNGSQAGSYAFRQRFRRPGQLIQDGLYAVTRE